MWIRYLCLSVMLVGACATVGRGPSSGGEVPLGEGLYVGHCAYCHGIGGSGGHGPRLDLPSLRRVSNNADLRRIIQRGIPGTEMPRVRRMTDREYSQLVRYVRSLGRVEAEPLSGDPAKGEALYNDKGACGACHIVAGDGGSLGPELTNVGARRNPSYLRGVLARGESSVKEDYLVVNVISPAAGRVRGIRVNEDSFTLQVRDANDLFYSFRKSDLTGWRAEPGATLMPDYRSQLTAAEIEDLVAYLAGLRGEE